MRITYRIFLKNSSFFGHTRIFSDDICSFLISLCKTMNFPFLVLIPPIFQVAVYRGSLKIYCAIFRLFRTNRFFLFIFSRGVAPGDHASALQAVYSSQKQLNLKNCRAIR